MNLRLALVGQNEPDEQEIERADHDPAVRGGPPWTCREGEYQEPDILGDPCAVFDNGALPLGPRQLYRDRHGATGERARERGRPGEQPRLPAHVVAIEPGGEAGADRRAPGGRDPPRGGGGPPLSPAPREGRPPRA